MILQLQQESIENGPIPLEDRLMCQGSFSGAWDNVSWATGQEIFEWAQSITEAYDIAPDRHWVLHSERSPHFILAANAAKE